MKANIGSLITVITLSLVWISPLEAKDYDDTTLKSILMDASEYKNDRVTYSASYGGFTTNAPRLLDKSGFKEGRDTVIKAGSPQFLIIADKDDVESTLIELKRGSIIQVFGKVREMKVDPKRGIGTGHYLELESLEVVKEAEQENAEQQKMGPKKKAKLIEVE